MFLAARLLSQILSSEPAMSSDLSLFYYYLDYGNATPIPIRVPPNTTVGDCRQFILEHAKSKSPPHRAELYRVPEEHAVNVRTLGALSVSSLGSPLVTGTMRDIFGLCPQQDCLHLVLVDRGMYRLWLERDNVNASYRQASLWLWTFGFPGYRICYGSI